MNKLDDTLNNFIAHTGKSKVAIIVPLYGYWSDVKDNPLNLQTLQLSIERLTSSAHSTYIILVAESPRLPKNIQNYIVVHSKAGGNFSGVDVPAGSSYADYVRAGFDAAQNTTESAYFVLFNPWNLIQRISVDMMVDRLNYGDEAKIVSGYNIRPEIGTDKFDPIEFERLSFNIPIEKHKVDSNFLGMTRFALEIIPLDTNIKTAKYLEYDMFQSMHAKGFVAIASQRVPMFVFDVNIGDFEDPVDLEADKEYFISKWGFIPEQ